MARSKQPPKDFECPACGADVPGGSKSCPECGACEKSGWSGNLGEDALGLDDDEFDYDKFVAEEFGSGAPKRGTQKLWAIVALVLFIAIAASILLGWWN